jgi:hypothetical protein
MPKKMLNLVYPLSLVRYPLQSYFDRKGSPSHDIQVMYVKKEKASTNDMTSIRSLLSIT